MPPKLLYDAKAQSKKLELMEFDFDKQLKLNTKILIVGKPESGKSTLIGDIAYHVCDKIPVANVWSNSELENHAYEDVFPRTAISNAFDLTRYTNVNIRQRILTHRRHPNPWCMDIIDDCPGSQFKDEQFMKAFKLGRHWSKLTIIGIHRAVDVTTDLRAATDYTFIFREAHPRERKALYENFAAFVTFKDFETILDASTENYSCLVVDNRSKSQKLNEIYYWYRATYRDYKKMKFRFGSQQFWDECDQDFNPEYNEEKEIFE